MTIPTGRRLRYLLAGFLVTTSTPAAALTGAPEANETAVERQIVVSQTVPVPRPNPRRPSDPIGALIGDQDAAGDGPDDDSEVAQADGEVGDPLDSVGFELAVELIRKGDPAGATIAAYALSDRVSADLVDWLIITSGDDKVPSERIIEIAPRFQDWPGTALVRLRLEQALTREKRSDEEFLAALDGQTPETDAAALVVSRALRASGREAEAKALVRDMWRDDNLDKSTEKNSSPRLPTFFRHRTTRRGWIASCTTSKLPPACVSPRNSTRPSVTWPRRWSR